MIISESAVASDQQRAWFSRSIVTLLVTSSEMRCCSNFFWHFEDHFGIEDVSWAK